MLQAQAAPPRALMAGLVALGVGLALRLILAATTDLYFDEAYYWTWSRRLALSYYDHPPLTAWLIAVLGVRTTAIVCGALTCAIVYALGRDVHGTREAGVRAAALCASVPALTLAGTFTTPDSTLALFWALALWAVWRERWILAGLAGGLALLSKYNAALLAIAVLLWAARERRLPRGAFLGGLVAVACFTPVVVWNAANGWEGFGFQLRHGLGGSGGLRSLGEYVAGQVLLGGPLVLPLALVWMVRGPRRELFLRLAAALPLAAFAFAAYRTRGEANWPATAYLAASVGLASLPRRWWWGALLANLVILAVGTAHVVHPLPIVPPERDEITARVHGWTRLRDLSREPAAAVFAPSYKLASEAAYYSGLPAGVAGSWRRSQYDLWGPPRVPEGGDALWLSEKGAPPEGLAAEYGSVEGPIALPVEYEGRLAHGFRYWRLKGRRQASDAPP